MTKFNKRTNEKKRKNHVQIPKGSLQKSINNQVHKFTRLVNSFVSVTPGVAAGTYGFNAAGSNSLQLTFSLSTLFLSIGGSTTSVPVPNSTDFSNLFESYRISHVEVMLGFNNNTETAPNVAATLPLIAVVKDFNDSTPLANLAAALQYDNCEIYQLGNVRGQSPFVRINMSPEIEGIAGPGTSNVIQVPKNTWLNTDSPATPYYGVKMVYDNYSTAAVSTICGDMSIYVKYLIECKDAK